MLSEYARRQPTHLTADRPCSRRHLRSIRRRNRPADGPDANFRDGESDYARLSSSGRRWRVPEFVADYQDWCGGVAVRDSAVQRDSAPANERQTPVNGHGLTQESNHAM